MRRRQDIASPWACSETLSRRRPVLTRVRLGESEGMLTREEAARILALRHGITQTGTLERLQALAEKGAIPQEEAEFIQTAYKTMLHFLLTSQARKIREGGVVNNYVAPGNLPIQERYILRHALEGTDRLQSVVHTTFGDLFF